MKKILIFTGLLFFIQIINAQVKEGKVIYERKINVHKRLPPENESMKSMIPEFNTSKLQVLFAGDECISKSIEEEEDIRDQAGHEGNRMNIRMGGNGAETYKNYSTEKTVELRELGPKKYIIEDSLRKFNWKLADETVTVLGHICKTATAKTRQGDNIIAWYTEDIAAPGGPEQFGGLPGFILKMDIGDGWLQFTALDIQPGSQQLVKAPTGGKKVSRQEFQKMMDEAFGPGNGGPQIRIITRNN